MNREALLSTISEYNRARRKHKKSSDAWKKLSSLLAELAEEERKIVQLSDFVHRTLNIPTQTLRSKFSKREER